MFILFIISLIFLGLAIKSLFGENFGSRFDPYFFFMLALSIGSAYLPASHIYFEYKLGKASAKLIGHEEVVVDCRSTFESLFNLGKAGFVYRGSNVINLDVETCDHLKGHLDHPATASPRELYALKTLTHEAMHVAGFINEFQTDCKAFQRNHRMAILLGVPEGIANQNAIYIHRYRSPRHPYYSADCEPGGPYDDNLPDAVWSHSKK